MFKRMARLILTARRVKEEYIDFDLKLLFVEWGLSAAVGG
jgi:hypothetical protein